MAAAGLRTLLDSVRYEVLPAKATEEKVLAHAVKWHSESRVMVDGNRTVVFR